MKIIFFGSDDFALVNLEMLIKSAHEVVACVTQPDQARGRGLKIASSPIKARAEEHGIPVFQPSDIKEASFVNELKLYDCDVFVVIAYGKILPSGLLQIPRLCAINVHASLLPKYRGAAPVNWAIINGETETGVSVIKMNERMDAGDILARAKIKIEKQDTSVTLRAKLAKLGAACLTGVIDSLGRGTTLPAGRQEFCGPTVQDNNAATFAPKLTKELGLISWEKSAAEIHNLVRGLLPWPTAYTYYKGKLLKILETEIITTTYPQNLPGVVVDISKNGLVVAAGKGHLLIKKVLPQSAKPMDVRSFIAGHKMAAGYRFEQKVPSS